MQRKAAAASLLAATLIVPLFGSSAMASAPSYVTRAQFIYDLDRQLGIQPVYPATPNFTDVPVSSPYYGFIEAAYEKGFISGFTATTFAPNAPLTRAQIAKIEVLALGDGAAAQALSTTYSGFQDDSQIGAWARGFVNEAVKLGLIHGYPNGDFMPGNDLTSADEVHFLSQLATIGETVGSYKVTVTPSTTDAGVGQVVTLSTAVTDPQGNAVPTPLVTYTVSSPTVLMSGNMLIASQPGDYTVTASYVTGAGTATGTAQIAIYGAPYTLKIVPPSALVANGASTSTVTVDVVDASGNVVTSSDNTISLSATGNAIAAITPAEATAVNGVATFTVTAGKVPGATTTLTASDPSITTGVNTVESQITSVAQVPTSLGVTAPSYITANTSGQQVIAHVQVLDQVGQPMLYGTYGFTASIAGPATFAGGLSGAQSYAYSGDGMTGAAAYWTPVVIQDIQAATGAITVIATAAGLAPGSATLTAVIAGLPVGIDLTSPTSTSFSEDQGATGLVYSLSAEDSHGYPVADPIPVLISVRNASGAVAQNILVDGHVQGSSGYLDTSAMGTGSFVLSDSQVGADAGTYTVSVTDPSATLSQSATDMFTETPGAAYSVTATAASRYVSVQNPETTITAQLVDKWGNPVQESGVPVTFSSSGNPYSATFGTPVVNTTAGGTASTTVTVPTYANVTYTVEAQATVNGAPHATYPVFTVQDTIATTISIAAQDTAKGSDSPGYYVGSGYAAFSSDQVTLGFKAVDQYGNPVTSSDVLHVTFGGIGSFATPTYLGGGSVQVNADGSWTVQLSGGEATVQAVAHTAGPMTITAQDTSEASQPTASAGFVISPGSVTGYALYTGSGTNVSTPAGSGGSGVTVEANVPVELWLKPSDAQGNATVSATSQTVTLSDGGKGGEFRSTPGGASFTSITVPAGTMALPIWYVNGTAGTYYLTGQYTAVPTTVALGSYSATPYVAGTVQSLVITSDDQLGQPLNGTYNVTIGVPSGSTSLLAQAPDGKTDARIGTSASMTGAVTLSATGQGSINLTFTNGQATLFFEPVAAQTTGDAFTVTVGTGASAPTQTTSTFDVTAAAPLTLASVNAPSAAATVGSAVYYTLNALDAYGNPAAGSFSGTTTLTVGGLLPSPFGVPASVTLNSDTTTASSGSIAISAADLDTLAFTGGSAKLPITFTDAAAQTLTFALTGQSAVTADSAFTPGAAAEAYYALITPKNAAGNTPWNFPVTSSTPLSGILSVTVTANAGTNYEVGVQLVDAYGNAVTTGADASGTVTVSLTTSTSSTISPIGGSISLSQGYGSFEYTTGAAGNLDTLSLPAPINGTGGTSFANVNF